MPVRLYFQPMRHESDWWLGGFLAGFLLGLALTLLYTWFLVPRTPPTTPANLNPHDKEIYTVLIAAAYRHTGDLQTARRQLADLKYRHPAETVAALTRAYIDRNADPRDIRSLATLADALGKTESYMLVYLATETATPSPTATATPTPLPTATPSPTAKPTVSRTITPRPTPTPATFGVAQSVPLCDPNGNRTLRIFVRSANGDGVPGVKVVVSWAGGENTLYTGFKSVENPGYADFTMAVNRTYTVKLPDFPGDDARDINISTVQCTNLPESIVPSWQLVFQQTP